MQVSTSLFTNMSFLPKGFQNKKGPAVFPNFSVLVALKEKKFQAKKEEIKYAFSNKNVVV